MGAGKSLAQALLEKQKKLEQMGIEVKEPEEVDIPNRWETYPKRVPMMYRAQVQGRSSLHNAQKRKDGKDSNLDIWSKEWINPTVEGEARYQRSQPTLGQDGDVYRIAVKFPFRLFSNGGQDSIMRPMLGKDGIPFLPGSSVKGLFLRACGDRKAAQYCGREVREQGKLQHLPGEMPLRFLGAYPVGNWADRVVDLVHPQGNRQIGTKVFDRGPMKEEGSTASALISLCEPTMVFEFSCADRAIQWRDVEFILLKALQLGVGGKTSSGYGLGGNFPGKSPINPASPISVLLRGDGVSSVLRDGVTPEFRTNLFKAGLRGHLRRLLGGVSESKAQEVADRWFGNTKAPAVVQLLWQERKPVKFADVGLKDRNPTYRVDGMLYADMRRSEPQNMTVAEVQQYDRDVALLTQIVTFAYVMGGFGKSWRRVWHGLFKKDYHAKNFAIGCHWVSSDLDGIQSEGELTDFLNELYQHCCKYLGIVEQNAKAASWREAWSPKRVAVFCRVGRESEAVELFHAEVFKTTPAIGGRSPGDKRPTGVSSVWHRMLPLKNGTEFLEIVTVFHGDRNPWKRDGIDQLLAFTQALKDRGLKLGWGTEPKP
jgi:CRISPR-associated protein Cmr6